MKISEFMLKLRDIVAEHGDLEIKRWNFCNEDGSEHKDIEEIKVYKGDPLGVEPVVIIC